MREQTPEHIYNRALQAKENSDRLIARSKDRIPEIYHDFIILLNETKKLTDDIVYIDDKTHLLGVWHKEGLGTMQTLPKPYMTVDGRVLWARNDHREAGKMLNIHEPVLSEDGKVMTVVVESEFLGKSVGVIELKNETTFVGKDNPYAVTQTSALGRALGFLGYGLIGSGISSEEIRQDSLEVPLAITSINEGDNEPREVTVIATSEADIKEQYATFTGVIENDEITATVPISKTKEINRIKPGFTVSGHVWFDGLNVRFSADNPIHVVSGIKRFSLKINTSPKFSDDGSCVFDAFKNNEKHLVKAPSALKEYLKDLLPGQVIKVDGLFIKGSIQLPRKNKIEVLADKVG